MQVALVPVRLRVDAVFRSTHGLPPVTFWLVGQSALVACPVLVPRRADKLGIPSLFRVVTMARGCHLQKDISTIPVLEKLYEPIEPPF